MVHVSKCAIHGSYEYWILTPYRVVTFSKQSGKNGKNTLMALEGLLFLKQKDVFFFEVATFETFLNNCSSSMVNKMQIYRIY